MHQQPVATHSSFSFTRRMSVKSYMNRASCTTSTSGRLLKRKPLSAATRFSQRSHAQALAPVYATTHTHTTTHINSHAHKGYAHSAQHRLHTSSSGVVNCLRAASTVPQPMLFSFTSRNGSTRLRACTHSVDCRESTSVPANMDVNEAPADDPTALATLHGKLRARVSVSAATAATACVPHTGLMRRKAREAALARPAADRHLPQPSRTSG